MAGVRDDSDTAIDLERKFMKQGKLTKRLGAPCPYVPPRRRPSWRGCRAWRPC
jgi:hypothetical protein